MRISIATILSAVFTVIIGTQGQLIVRPYRYSYSGNSRNNNRAHGRNTNELVGEPRVNPYLYGLGGVLLGAAAAGALGGAAVHKLKDKPIKFLKESPICFVMHSKKRRRRSLRDNERRVDDDFTSPSAPGELSSSTNIVRRKDKYDNDEYDSNGYDSDGYDSDSLDDDYYDDDYHLDTDKETTELLTGTGTGTKTKTETTTQTGSGYDGSDVNRHKHKHKNKRKKKKKYKAQIHCIVIKNRLLTHKPDGSIITLDEGVGSSGIIGDGGEVVQLINARQSRKILEPDYDQNDEKQQKPSNE